MAVVKFNEPEAARGESMRGTMRQEMAEMEEVTKMHTIRKTVLEMLSDRGYDVSPFDLAMSKDHLLTRKDLEINVSKMDDPSDKMYIFFPEEELIRVATWRTCFDSLHSAQAFKAILVVRGRLTHQAQTCIDVLPPPFRIEIFEEKRLNVQCDTPSACPQT